MSDLFDMAGRVVCISGSSRGLGRALAGCFADLGAKLVLSSHEPDDLETARRELADAGAKVCTVQADVRRQEDCARMVDTAIERFGALDVMICNAGTDIIKPAETYESREWDEILSVNLRGYYYCAQAAASHMLERGSGSIVMTSSVAGAVGIPGLAPYAASKGGANQLVRTMAVEWAESNVRVNAVAPGFINNFMDGVHPDTDTPYQRRALNFTPMGRRGDLSEYFGPFVFLASAASSFVTGEVLYVDGGYHAT